MGVLATILSAAMTGFVIGGAARWAVPGPDPMPFWLTVLIGLLGSLIGGVVAAAIFGSAHALDTRGHAFVTVLVEIGAAAGLVIAYRRLVQKRPIAGPDAHRFPTRGIGIARLRKRLQQLGVDPDAAGDPLARLRKRGGSPEQEDATDVVARLRELEEQHDRGEIGDEEYERRRDELQRR